MVDRIIIGVSTGCESLYAICKQDYRVIFNVVEVGPKRELFQCLVAYNNLYHHICCEIVLKLVL